MPISKGFIHQSLLTTGIALSLGIYPLEGRAQSIGTDITSLTINTTASNTRTINNIAGDSEFAGETYRLRFLGLTQAITGFAYTGGTATVESAIPAHVVARRKPASDKRQLAWYFGTLNADKTVFTLFSAGPLAEEQLFSGNNILAGYDNVFTNQGANVGGQPYNGNNGIERVDYILHTSVEASDTTGFVVFERGAAAGHDAFGIAAITEVDAAGNPVAYGPIYFLGAGSWGRPTLLTPIPQTYFFNNAAKRDRGIPTNPALTVPAGQTLGGILIRTNELVPAGQPVYGYSLFGPDVTCSSAELVDIGNACFPANTGVAGGIDLPAVNLGAVKLK